MKTIIAIGVIGMLLFGMTSSTTVSYPSIKSRSYGKGEVLRYRLSYGIMDAGEAVLSVNETTVTGADNRPLLHVKGEGKTLGAFNWFYEVKDVYESYIDKEGGFPWYFLRDVNEGGYTIKQKYVFHQNKQKVQTENKKNNKKDEFNVPLGIQDMISSFYYARTIDFSNLKPGDIIEFKCFMDEEIWPLKIKYLGKEEVKIRSGKFKTLKFTPAVQKGRVFGKNDDLQVWITDDANHIPVLAKAKIAVGSIKMHLVEWQGLKGKISKI
ncbi:MAG: DUF3108 domain-containing protein [Brumimicrobium sp.]|nr:DUF3108 domain-containing protein [Brumimicrobium sp.]MCO5267296.1 DUF3108 domain-containing protein [Brumimicrobium sp.]